ncbi:GAP family protein [Nocardia brevicatena]|uniref:GAP family protein n=1 Tax=Nocardia brevicatena TaxID=37327 RepID=UPI0002DD6493|nr:GAP family protein [Nocardia brevicatena]
MGAVIGDLLPLAVGVAISPIPVLAAIMMILSKNAAGAGRGFALGWVAGIAAATVIMVLLAGSMGGPADRQPSTAGSWLKIALGVLLLGLAVLQWRARADTAIPRWMRAINELTVGRAVGLGVLLSAVNPKNLLLCVSAGVVIGAGGISVGGQAVAVVVFTLLAAAGVLVVILGYTLAADRLRAPLGRLRAWLQDNNHMVMAIVLLIMGAVVLGKGIGGFWPAR